MTNTNTLLLAQEVADLLRITRNALYLGVRAGRIPARKHGRRVLFVRAEIDAMIAALPPAGRQES